MPGSFRRSLRFLFIHCFSVQTLSFFTRIRQLNAAVEKIIYLLEIPALGDLVPVGGGSYSVKRSLEQYAGKTVDLYLVAEADDTGYANSPNGIVYTMTVPERLSAPRVKWAYSWLGDASSDPVAASDFRNGGLTVTVTPQDAAT